MIFSRDDLLAVSLGFLVIIAAINISLRVAFAVEKSRTNEPLGRDRADSDMSENSTTNGLGVVNLSHLKIFLLLLVSMTTVAVVLPLMMGLSLQLVLINPLRFVQGVADTPPRPHRYSQYAPIWIVGMMMLKIFVAVISIGNNGGVSPRLRIFVDQITRTYDRDGPLSVPFSTAILKGSWQIGRPLLLRIFLPSLIIIVLNRVDVLSEMGRVFGLPAILAIMAVRELVIPAICEFYEDQKRSIRDRKYLIRTELRNFVPPQNTANGGILITGVPLRGSQADSTIHSYYT
jgi:hypothetical protein